MDLDRKTWKMIALSKAIVHNKKDRSPFFEKIIEETQPKKRK